jgi:peptidyl-prolyl cis-trans isomerase A (cyclophilin A)
MLPAVVFCLGLWACSRPQYKNPHIEITTKFGTIEAELYPDKAPKSVAAFLSYVDSGFYENTAFYRVLNEDNQPTGAADAALIQGGLWGTHDKQAAAIPLIPHETTQQTGLHHEDGTLSLARQAPGTASTEFFICIGSQPGFDFGGSNNGDGQGYAAFGKVVKGMDIVNRIHRQPSDGERFVPQVSILNIERL